MKWIAVGLLLASAPAFAQSPDVATGQGIAARWCGECHQIAPNLPAKDNVPSFVEIAKRPGTDADTLRAFLRQPHGRMPPLTLTELEIRNLIAYILTLK